MQAAGDEVQVGAEPARRAQVDEHRGVDGPAQERGVAVADLVAPVEEPPEGDLAAGAGAAADERRGLAEIDAAVVFQVLVHVGDGDDAVRQRGPHPRARLLVLEHPREVVDPAVAGEGTPVAHEVVGPPAVGGVGPGAPRVHALHEPGVGPEVRVDGVERRAVAEVAALAVVGDVGGRPGALRPRLVAVLRPRVEHRQRRRAAQAEAAVDGRDAAVGVQELPVGRHDPDGGFRVQIVPGAPDEYPGRLAEGVGGKVVPLAGRLVVGDQHPEGGVADLAGQLRAVPRIDDGAGVQQVDLPGQREDLLALEEEGTQLGEEQGVPLVDLDLRGVRLDLREVGVVGEVGGQVRGHPVLHVQGAFGLRLLVERPRRGVERPVPDRGDRRQNLQVAARGQVREPVEQAHLGQEAGDSAGDRGPHVGLVLAEDRPHDLEAPPVRLARAPFRVPQALERNRHLRRPAVGDQSRRRVEEGVPREVAGGGRPQRRGERRAHAAAAAARGSAAAPAGSSAAAAAGHALGARLEQGVGLHPIAVHREDVGALLVEERVEVDGHRVVDERLVAVGPVGADQGGVRVVRTDAEVEVVVVVGDIDLGVLGGRRPVEGALLHEVADARGPFPHGIVEGSVDAGGGGGALGTHAGAAGEDAGAAGDADSGEPPGGLRGRVRDSSAGRCRGWLAPGRRGRRRPQGRRGRLASAGLARIQAWRGLRRPPGRRDRLAPDAPNHARCGRRRSPGDRGRLSPGGPTGDRRGLRRPPRRPGCGGEGRRRFAGAGRQGVPRRRAAATRGRGVLDEQVRIRTPRLRRPSRRESVPRQAGGEVDGDAVLQREDLVPLAVGSDRVDHDGRRQVDDPGVDAEPLPDLLVAAGDRPARAEPAVQLPEVAERITAGRVAGPPAAAGSAAGSEPVAGAADHVQAARFQLRRERLGDAVAQPGVVRVGREVGEREHGDRTCLRGRERRLRTDAARGQRQQETGGEGACEADHDVAGSAGSARRFEPDDKRSMVVHRAAALAGCHIWRLSCLRYPALAARAWHNGLADSSRGVPPPGIACGGRARPRVVFRPERMP